MGCLLSNKVTKVDFAFTKIEPFCTFPCVHDFIFHKRCTTRKEIKTLKFDFESIDNCPNLAFQTMKVFHRWRCLIKKLVQNLPLEALSSQKEGRPLFLSSQSLQQNQNSIAMCENSCKNKNTQESLRQR